ncbi:classical arabinogalactan protein 4 isoform X2 [Triticum aestivum]|nr:classical arabinogalactan protein 4-like isoform X2 [Triticum aestivum]
MEGLVPVSFHSSRARAAAASATAYPRPSAPPPTLRRRRPLLRPPPRRTLLCPASSASLEQPFPIPAASSLPEAAPAQQHRPRTYAGAASHVRCHTGPPLPRLKHFSGSAAPIPAGPSDPAAAAPAQQRRPRSYAGR